MQTHKTRIPFCSAPQHGLATLTALLCLAVSACSTTNRSALPPPRSEPEAQLVPPQRTDGAQRADGLAGTGGLRGGAGMAPIPNPADLELEERRKIYGTKYDHLRYRPNSGAAAGSGSEPVISLRSWRNANGVWVVATRPVPNPEDMSPEERRSIYNLPPAAQSPAAPWDREFIVYFPFENTTSKLAQAGPTQGLITTSIGANGVERLPTRVFFWQVCLGNLVKKSSSSTVTLQLWSTNSTPDCTGKIFKSGSIEDVIAVLSARISEAPGTYTVDNLGRNDFGSDRFDYSWQVFITKEFTGETTRIPIVVSTSTPHDADGRATSISIDVKPDKNVSIFSTLVSWANRFWIWLVTVPMGLGGLVLGFRRAQRWLRMRKTVPPPNDRPVFKGHPPPANENAGRWRLSQDNMPN